MGINHYVHRDALKAALTIPASTTGQHDQLDDAAHTISRAFDEYAGFHFYPSSGTRYYTPKDSDCLYLNYPLLSLDSIQTSSDGGSTYGSTIATGDVYLNPPNATEESPKRPRWEIEIKPNVTSSAVFPSGITRGAKVTGTWGYFNETKGTSASLSTALTSGSTALELNVSSDIHPGQTILIGSEKMFVKRNGKSGSDTATTSGTVFVDRAVNGTVAAAHTSGAAVRVYEYPMIDRAALYQAEQDYRGKDMPMGVAGGEPFGQQRSQPGIGLHPFTRRLLDSFRTPIAG